MRRRALPQAAALRIAADLLEAVAAAEEHGLAVAGGVRPDFVLVGVDGRTRLLEPVQEFLNPVDGTGGDGQGSQRRTIAPPPAEPPGA